MKHFAFLFFLIGIYNISIASEISYLANDSAIVTSVKDKVFKGKKDSLGTSLSKDTLNTVLHKTNDSLNNQSQNSQNAGLDKIIKRSGDSILCRITAKNLFEVEYLKPGFKTKLKLSTSNIKEIYYADGKYELIENAPEKKKKDWTVDASEVDWKNIKITYESSEVAGLIEKGKVETKFEAKKMKTDNESLEKNACTVLKKKAYPMNATIILITDKKFSHMYGEMPSIKIAGTAYGKE